MSPHAPRATRTLRAPENLALAGLYVFTALAIVGYATFGRHPALLARTPGAAGVYGAAFTFFARAHVMLAAAALLVALVRHARGRWVTAFVAVYLLSLGSELAGTTVGLPFGPYRYTDGLGLKWFGHVPLLIPVSWFSMALPSFLLARRALPAASRGRVGAALGVVLGSFVLLAWDLALDPAMSRVTQYWEWASEGTYYGMPLLNLFGWYVTGLVLMTALAATDADAWGARLSTRWLVAFYAANLALPLGLVAAAGLWIVVLVSLVGVASSLGAPRLVAAVVPAPPSRGTGPRAPTRTA